MQIIFDENLISKLRERHIVLELDTVYHEGMEKPLTLYTVVEYPGIEDFSLLNDIVDSHNEMIKNYKSNNLELAVIIAENLKKAWNAKLDEFYDSVISTCKHHLENNLEFTGIKHTNPSVK